MKYRVAFKVYGGGRYYTEWFDTVEEARNFTVDIDAFTRGVFIRHIEDENHNII